MSSSASPSRFYLLDQFNTSSQIHPEIYESPRNSFSFILFLLQDEHVMIKELLKLFIGEVDAQLLETIELLMRTNFIKDKLYIYHI